MRWGHGKRGIGLRRPLSIGLGVIVALMIAGGCQPRELPEQGSDAAQLYQQRCGQCHRPFEPRAMTAAMWQLQVEAMQEKMRRAGLEPLSSDQRQEILDYLTRNAGAQ